MADQRFPEPELSRQVRYVLGEFSPNVGQIRGASIVLADYADKEGTVNLNIRIGKSSDVAGTAAKDHINIFMAGVKWDQEGRAPGTWHWPEFAALPQPKKTEVPAK